MSRRAGEVGKRPLAELSTRYLREGARLPGGLLESLEADERAGARELARKLKAQRSERRHESHRLGVLLRYEQELWDQGVELIAGVDEAGVGPCAGPVVAGAVILPRRYRLTGLDDSKKVLDEDRREELALAIKADAVCWAVGCSEVEEIDRVNIYQASLLAMQRAVAGLSTAPGFCLVDARKIPGIGMPQRAIIRGDALSASIAAASILAKTTRDRLMAILDRQYPGWGLAAHKGYATAEHFARLREKGACPAHRRSFAPVREALGLVPRQEELFDPLEDPDEPAGEAP
ncbi:MAG: ribonuclease HII [Myxococcaceae bacterium]